MNLWFVYESLPVIYTDSEYKDYFFQGELITNKAKRKKVINIFKESFKFVFAHSKLPEVENFNFKDSLIEKMTGVGFENSVFWVCYDRDTDTSIVLSDIQFDDEYFYTDWVIQYSPVSDNQLSNLLKKQ